MTTQNTARELLLGLGMGNYNATLAIQFMFLAPSSTDPAMPSIMLMTKHLQMGLRSAGAGIAVTGQIDDATARALSKLVGPDWHHVTWYQLFQSVTLAKKHQSLHEPSQSLGLIDVPSIPGGALTLAAVAAAAWYFLVYKKH